MSGLDEVEHGKRLLHEAMAPSDRKPWEWSLSVSVHVPVTRGELVGRACVYRERWPAGTTAVLAARLGVERLRSLGPGDPVEVLLRLDADTALPDGSAFEVFTDAAGWADRFPGAQVQFQLSGSR